MIIHVDFHNNQTLNFTVLTHNFLAWIEKN